MCKKARNTYNFCYKCLAVGYINQINIIEISIYLNQENVGMDFAYIMLGY